MPILFLALGLFLIVICFGYIDFKSIVLKCCWVISIAMIMCGYFTSHIFIGKVSFNVLFALSIVVLFVYLFNKSKVYLSDMLFLIFVGTVYYLMLDDDLSFMVGYSTYVKWCIAFAVVLFYSSNLFKGCFISLCLSMVIMCVSAFYGFDNFGVMELDFLFCLNCIFYSLLFIAFRNVFANYLLRRVFDEKINCNYFVGYVKYNAL